MMRLKPKITPPASMVRMSRLLRARISLKTKGSMTRENSCRQKAVELAGIREYLTKTPLMAKQATAPRKISM